MGVHFSCPDCTKHLVNRYVVNISDRLFKRITEGYYENGDNETDADAEEAFLPDEEWMARLKCMDDAHSKVYGLTENNFNRLVSVVQYRMSLMGYLDPCTPSKERVCDCYEKHRQESLECATKGDHYIRCVEDAVEEKVKKYLKSK